MITSKYFSESEFNRCTPSCSLQDMRQETMDMFDKAREIAGIPLVINSAFRSVAWDKAKGRSGRSAHTTGSAIDIRCNNGQTRMIVVKALMEAGFKRIGIEGSFVHADNSNDIPYHTEDTMWVY